MRYLIASTLCLLPFLALAEEPPAFDWQSRDWEPVNLRINTDGTGEIQNEEQVVVNPLDPDNVVACWRDFRLGYRRVGVGYSFDGGLSWTDYLVDEENYPWHSDPGLTVDRFGNFYLVILSYVDTSNPNGLYVLKSTDGGMSWSEPVEVINQVPNVFEDKELIACDRSMGPHDGNLYVAWTRFSWTTEILCARSLDLEDGFEDPVEVSDANGVQWPVPCVGEDGTLYVGWVQYSPARIRLDRSFDGGETFGSDLTISSIYSASATLNGNLKSYSYPALDCDLSDGPYRGRLYAAYMDRVGGQRDVFLRYSDDRGTSWSYPLRVNDDSPGNNRDQFHPWLCVSPDGVVSIVFYDRRHDPSNLLMDLYLAQSHDGGNTIEPNLRVSTVSSDPTASRAGLIGEYIGLAASSGERIHPVWTDTRHGDQDVFTASITLGETAVTDFPLENALRLSRNPFPESTTFLLNLDHVAEVELSIYDPAGRRITRLVRGTLLPGLREIPWDAGDLPSGLYLYRLRLGERQCSGKLLKLR
jgi:hypothetical protein